MAVLTHNQEVFAAQLAKLSGLNLNVVRGWVLAEESGSAARARETAGNQNWLNLAVGPSGDRFNAGWSDPIVAASNTYAALKGTKYKTGSLYAGILATAGAHPGDQIEAIAVSPWDAGHYGGGSHLVSTYHLVSGLPAPHITSASSESPTASTATAPGAAQKPQSRSGKAAAAVYIPSAHLQGSSIPLPSVAGFSPFGHLRGADIPLPPLIEPAAPTAKAAPAVKPSSPLTPSTPTPTTPTPSGKTGVFEGTTVASWMIPALVYGRTHGWTGKLTSGVRTTAEQAVLYQRYKAGGNIAAKPGQSNHEIQNGGAFDATDGSQLWKILQGYTGKRPIWAPSVGLNDSVHFSVNGH